MSHRLHRALVKRKYQLLFTPKRRGTPGPKGPSTASIAAIVEMKRRNPRSDHDPLFEFHRWKANLRILEVKDVKTVPYVPLSHPFVERLIGTIRREFLDFVPFWTTRDLERKLASFMD